MGLRGNIFLLTIMIPTFGIYTWLAVVIEKALSKGIASAFALGSLTLIIVAVIELRKVALPRATQREGRGDDA